MNNIDKPHIQLINGRYGPCYTFKKDEYIGRSVFSYGEYNKDECEHLLNSLMKKRV